MYIQGHVYTVCVWVHVLFVCVHRNALWCIQKHMNVLCTMCRYMPKHMCVTRMYVHHVCMCVAHAPMCRCTCEFMDGYRYMHACMCDGYMCMHTSVYVMDISVCMPVNVRWMPLCVCGVCICVHSCICADKIAETVLCLQSTGLGHSHWIPQILWFQVSNLLLVGQRLSFTGELPRTPPQCTPCPGRTPLHRPSLGYCVSGRSAVSGPREILLPLVY